VDLPALLAHHLAARLRALEPLLQGGDAVAGETAVGLDLGLARASRPDPAAEALEVGPQPAHAGEVVLELCQLDLQLALGAARMQGEDVEDHARAIDDPHLERVLEAPLLIWSEVILAHQYLGVQLAAQDA
jgi:hypothetical protein